MKQKRISTRTKVFAFIQALVGLAALFFVIALTSGYNPLNTPVQNIPSVCFGGCISGLLLLTASGLMLLRSPGLRS